MYLIFYIWLICAGNLISKIQLIMYIFLLRRVIINDKLSAPPKTPKVQADQYVNKQREPRTNSLVNIAVCWWHSNNESLFTSECIIPFNQTYKGHLFRLVYCQEIPVQTNKNISHCAQNISTLDQNIVDKRDGSMEDLTIVCQVKRYGYYLLENFLGLLFFGKISILSKYSQQKWLV